MERVMIFIDGSNFYYGLRDALGTAKIDFDIFNNLLCGQERRLVHVHYYNVRLRQAVDKLRYAEQQKFFFSSTVHSSLRRAYREARRQRKGRELS